MKERYLTNYSEKLAEKVYFILNRNKSVLGIAIGYIGSTLIQILDILYEGNELSYIVDKYVRVNASTIIISVSIFVVLLYFIGEKLLHRYLNKKSIDNRFLELVESYKSELFSNQTLSGYGWGNNQTFVAVPRIYEGLETKDIEFAVNHNFYNWRELQRFDDTLKDRNLEIEYKKYLSTEFYQDFTYDSERLMLVKKPSIYTDDHRMKIELKKIKWSELQFYWKHVLKSDEQKRNYINKFYASSEIFTPNSFCLHLVVLTEDNKVLIVKNAANKFTDYPNKWTASLGEQIDFEDVKDKEEDCAYKWVLRALKEELALTEGDIDKRNIKYLSINLEGDVCNFTFMCIAIINKTSEELETYLKTEVRPDNEFDDIKFLDLEDIPKELVKPSLEYHPSSQLRMLYTYIHQRGKANIKRKILDYKFNK